MSRLHRRDFLRLGGSGAALGVAAVAGLGAKAEKPALPTGGALLEYPRAAIARAAQLKPGVAVPFSYPDSGSPCVLLKLPGAEPSGVGPQRDIVAYSNLCAHMGCPLQYDAEVVAFRCGCHFSLFDPELGGQQICGQATEGLPRIVLEHDAATDEIRAVAVEGLIYGRVSNLL